MNPSSTKIRLGQMTDSRPKPNCDEQKWTTCSMQNSKQSNQQFKKKVQQQIIIQLCSAANEKLRAVQYEFCNILVTIDTILPI